MSSYNPPLNASSSVFNPTNYNYQNNLTSLNQLSKYYCQYPIVQGSLSISGNLSVNGSTTINNSLILTKPTKAPTTWIAPLSGEIGFTITGANTTTYTMSSGTYKQLSSIVIPIGIWIIQYTLLISTLPSDGMMTAGISTITTSMPIAPNNTAGSSVVARPYISGSSVINNSSPTTYYLNTIGFFAVGAYALNSGTYTFSATRIA